MGVLKIVLKGLVGAWLHAKREEETEETTKLNGVEYQALLDLVKGEKGHAHENL